MESQVTPWVRDNRRTMTTMLPETKVSHPIPLSEFFGNRKVAICSMHGKEHVMRPLIEKYLGLEVESNISIDTDVFGTFSGEVERQSDPISTLRNKILAGLQSSGLTLGIGNEGSFGPHPEMPFVPCNQEIVMLIDLHHNIEIFDAVTVTNTNHGQKEVKSVKDLVEFATQVNFPSHALILKQVKDEKIIKIRKGILGWELLYTVMYQFSRSETKLIAETDMRAHLNPTRMKVIQQATESLLTKLVNVCPRCQWPGFACVEVTRGLKCRQCGYPTRTIRSQIYQCRNCYYTDERLYTEGEKAEPQYCDHCNP